MTYFRVFPQPARGQVCGGNEKTSLQQSREATMNKRLTSNLRFTA